MNALDMLTDDEAWMDQAACADVDDAIFYPDTGHNPDAAVQVCDGCTVRDDCLEWADRTGMHDGVLGGRTAGQRQRARARARAADPTPDRQRRWPMLYRPGWIEQQVADGATQADIAARLGCSRTLVSSVMREQGIVPNRVAERADQYAQDVRLAGHQAGAA